MIHSRYTSKNRPSPGSGKDVFQPDLVTPVQNYLLNSVGFKAAGSVLKARPDYDDDVGFWSGFDLTSVLEA